MKFTGLCTARPKENRKLGGGQGVREKLERKREAAEKSEEPERIRQEAKRRLLSARRRSRRGGASEESVTRRRRASRHTRRRQHQAGRDNAAKSAAGDDFRRSIAKTRGRKGRWSHISHPGQRGFLACLGLAGTFVQAKNCLDRHGLMPNAICLRHKVDRFLDQFLSH